MMLETNPLSLSPSIPQSMEYYGLWDQEATSPTIKLEPSSPSPDIMELIDANVTTTIHHHGDQTIFSEHHQQPHQLHHQGSPSPVPQYLVTHTPPQHQHAPPDDQYNQSCENHSPTQTFEYFPIDHNHNHPNNPLMNFNKCFPSPDVPIGHVTHHDEFHDYFLHQLPPGNVGVLEQGLQGFSDFVPIHGFHQQPSPLEYACWEESYCDPEFANLKSEGCFSSGVSDLDSEELDSKSSSELTTSPESASSYRIPQKRRVGRPPKKDKKLKSHDKKTGRLWEFIRDLLKNPDYCPSLVKWENVDEGLFRFVNSEKVAQLWGQIKGNPRMTYEKLSRAMRYYYKSHVFEPVLGRRLVYKFGCNATNWKPTNNNYMTSAAKMYNLSPSTPMAKSEGAAVYSLDRGLYFKN